MTLIISFAFSFISSNEKLQATTSVNDSPGSSVPRGNGWLLGMVYYTMSKNHCLFDIMAECGLFIDVIVY